MYGKSVRTISPRQHGMVLIISLLILVVIALVSAAMMRSLEGNVLATGNMAFHEAAEAAISQGLQNAQTFISNTTNAGSAAFMTDNGSASYYASLQGSSDASGIPSILLGTSVPSGYGGIVLNDNAGNQIRYAIERLCAAAGARTTANCNIPPALSADIGGTGQEHYPPPATANTGDGPFRVTVRVDGPAGTRVFGQTVFN